MARAGVMVKAIAMQKVINEMYLKQQWVQTLLKQDSEGIIDPIVANLEDITEIAVQPFTLEVLRKMPQLREVNSSGNGKAYSTRRAERILLLDESYRHLWEVTADIHISEPEDGLVLLQEGRSIQDELVRFNPRRIYYVVSVTESWDSTDSVRENECVRICIYEFPGELSMGEWLAIERLKLEAVMRIN